jgi:hypothetical protein
VQNFEILESVEGPVADFGDPVPGEVDLLEFGGMHEQVLRQSCDLERKLSNRFFLRH